MCRAIRRQVLKDAVGGGKQLEDFRGFLYFIEVELGEPTQTVKLVVDTGSFEMWINPNCSAAADQVVCEGNGHYLFNVSTHLTPLGSYFDFKYGTGFASGEYYGDWMYFRESNLLIAQQFGIANQSSYAVAGILGLGYGSPANLDYPSTLDSMVQYNRISAPIFSVDFGGQGDGFSEIVFGGVNRYKYVGNLEPIQIWPTVDDQPQGWTQYWVNLTSMGVSKPADVAHGEKYTSDAFVLNVLVDTGSTFTYLWPPLVDVIAQQFGAWKEHDEYMVNCTDRMKNGTVNFGFNYDRMVIRVRYKDFVVLNQDGSCSLGVQPATTLYVLGDTFIRGAYLVFDQQTDQIWMANYVNCGDGVSEVGHSYNDTATMVGLCK